MVVAVISRTAEREKPVKPRTTARRWHLSCPLRDKDFDLSSLRAADADYTIFHI
jgi:hypothetical protein